MHIEYNKAWGGTHSRKQTFSAAWEGVSVGQAANTSQKPVTNVSWVAAPQCSSYVLGSPCSVGHRSTRGMEKYICLQNKAGGVSLHGLSSMLQVKWKVGNIWSHSVWCYATVMLWRRRTGEGGGGGGQGQGLGLGTGRERGGSGGELLPAASRVTRGIERREKERNNGWKSAWERSGTCQGGETAVC